MMPWLLRGFAVPYGQFSCALTGTEPLYEKIARGAFRLFGDTISIKVLHEGSGRVGSTWNNSLALWGDRFGLAFELRVPVTPAGAGLRSGCQWV